MSFYYIVDSPSNFFGLEINKMEVFKFNIKILALCCCPKSKLETNQYDHIFLLFLHFCKILLFIREDFRLYQLFSKLEKY